ncbi:hypothetical protein [Roseiconus lacunae]|uniref:Uncharacterized protein n=1 Tax=Roseiconus lacunae TaxID=2605694 RepID=A0ABT7PNU6_9BACT|nr:hypothetical protein [Roseiconus lacunae]MDM4018180.1 hypothetical protein [Roseiconus lacunae]
MMRIAALEEQKSLRDLAGLTRLCDDVAWCDSQTLASTTEPAVIVGLWLFDQAGPARKLIDARAEAGLTTIIVPRFKTGDLKVVLKTPTSVRLKAGEYDEFQWDDDTGVNVGGQTLIDSSLHKGQWGSVAGMGETVLAFRAHEAAGWTVLCTAAVTSKKFGVDVEAQRWLLTEIVNRTAESSPAPASAPNEDNVQPVASVDELLAGNNEQAPAVVLAVALNDGNREVEIVSNTLSRIGFELSDDDIQSTLSRMADHTTDELEWALRQSGFGAYLRRGRSVLAEGGVE